MLFDVGFSKREGLVVYFEKRENRETDGEQMISGFWIDYLGAEGEGGVEGGVEGGGRGEEEEWRGNEIARAFSFLYSIIFTAMEDYCQKNIKNVDETRHTGRL